MNYEKKFLDYIKKETRKIIIDKNNDSITRSDLIEWCEELNIKWNNKTSLMLLKDILNKDITYIDFYNRFKWKAYGVHTSKLCKMFRINNYQLKLMIETHFFNIAYIKKEKNLNGILKNEIYIDSENFYSLNKERIDTWRSINIKGYINKYIDTISYDNTTKAITE